MKILLTGANGYIGRQLLPRLLGQGHEVVAMVRDEPVYGVETVKADLLEPQTFDALPKDIDAAYYLVHSMSQSHEKFEELEARAARHFVEWIETTTAKKIIYLGALATVHSRSRHLASRLAVERILQGCSVPTLTLRTGIIIGAGSASFEIMSDLVNRLPIMVAPRWVQSKCQPIAVEDILHYLVGALDIEGGTYEIGGPDILTYREMLLRLAKVRGLRRWILNVSVLTPRLSSYWLFLVTKTNFSLARSLVESLKSDAICQEQGIDSALPHACLLFDEAVRRAK